MNNRIYFSLIFLSVSFFVSTVVYSQKNCALLCNPSFEAPTQSAGTYGLYKALSTVSCWGTTAPDKFIEIWGNGFGGVPAYEGKNFAELNANYVSTLYQDFNIAAAATVTIGFAHRGRVGVDVMSVSIGPVGGPFTTLGTYSDGNTAWGYYTIPYSFPTAGMYSLRFNSITSAGGNQGVGNFLDAITITLTNPKITPTIIQPTCPGFNDGSISLGIQNGTKPYSFSWTPTNTSTNENALNLTVGIYSVIVSDALGCQTTATYELSHLHPAIQKTMQLTNCDSYTWSATNKTYTQSGSYQANLQTIHGCDSIVDLNLTINKSTSGIQDVTDCEQYTWPANGQKYTQSGTFKTTLINSMGCDSVVTLNLTLNMPDSVVQNDTACKSYTWNGQTYNTSGKYTYKTVNIHGCDSIVVLQLTLKPIEDVSSTQVPTNCGLSNGSIEITGVTGGTSPFKYALSGGISSSNTIYSGLNSGIYSVEVTDSNNCSFVLNNLIIDSSLPISDIIVDTQPEICFNKNGSLQIVDVVNGNAPYQITINNGSTTGSSFENLTAGLYTVQVSDNLKCVYSKQVSIGSLEQSELGSVPNVFTPNGDAINDEWFVEAACLENYQCQILNRWGDLVFESKNWNQKWNGKDLKGNELVEGTYFYRISAKFYGLNEKNERSGFIQLIK
jgi:gliding motility-associated-like protein